MVQRQVVFGELCQVFPYSNKLKGTVGLLIPAQMLRDYES